FSTSSVSTSPNSGSSWPTLGTPKRSSNCERVFPPFGSDPIDDERPGEGSHPTRPSSSVPRGTWHFHPSVSGGSQRTTQLSFESSNSGASGSGLLARSVDQPESIRRS